EPDHREREVDEAPVEVRPRAVAFDRPQHRDPVPGHECGEEAERDDGLARERGPRQPRQRADDDRRRHRQRGHADPDEPSARRPVREEHRNRRQGPAGTEQQPSRPAIQRPEHQRRRLTSGGVESVVYNLLTRGSLPPQGRSADFSSAPGSPGMRIRPAAITLALLALVAGLAAAALTPSSAAASTKPCWERVIDDWLDNGTIDGHYKASCYQQALKRVPEDLRDYSNITDAISAALSDSLRGSGTGSSTPGAGNGSGSGSGSGSGKSDPTGGPPRKTQAAPPQSIYSQGIN